MGNAEHDARSNTAMLFVMRIRDAYPRMSLAERRVADCVTQNGKELLDASAKEIAERTGTSAATVIRFCKACGFSGLAELKLTMQKEYSLLHGVYRDLPLDRDNSVAAVKQRVMSYHNMVVNAMLSTVDDDAYLRAADAMLNAGQILIIGEGGSQPTASCLTHVGLLLGLPCQMVVDSIFQSLAIRRMSEGDVAVGVTFTGRAQATVSSLRQAKQRGATTIALAGMPDSPITEHADVVLSTNLLERGQLPAIMSVRVAEMAAVEVLYGVLVNRIGKDAENSVHLGLSVAEESRREPFVK